MLYILEDSDKYKLVDGDGKILAIEAKLSSDDTGREHKGKGDGGGQFTKKAAGKTKTITEVLPRMGTGEDQSRAITSWVHKPGDMLRDGMVVVESQIKSGKVKYTARDVTDEDRERWNLENKVSEFGHNDGMPDEEKLRVYERLNQITPGKYDAEVKRWQDHHTKLTKNKKLKENKKNVADIFNAAFDEAEKGSNDAEMDRLEAIGARIDNHIYDEWTDELAKKYTADINNTVRRA